MKKSILWMTLVIWSVTASLVLAQESAQKQLFINLTTQDTIRAGMAIEFSTKVMKMKQMPATIFLNARAVGIAQKGQESPMHASGATLQEMLKGFMAKGGTVYICPMCMKNVGKFKADQVIPGVTIAGKDTLDALFADGTKVMSY